MRSLQVFLSQARHGSESPVPWGPLSNPAYGAKCSLLPTAYTDPVLGVTRAPCTGPALGVTRAPCIILALVLPDHPKPH